MTTSEFTGARPVRRRGRLAAAAASVAGSALVHGAFAMVAAGVAWHVVGTSREIGRDVVIHFDEPGLAEGVDEHARPMPAAQAAPTMPERAAGTRAEHAAVVAPIEPPSAEPGRDLPPSVLAAGAAGGGSSRHEGASAATVVSEGEAVAPGGVRFAGLGASNARSVVYVVDASGPMVTSLPRVLEEVVRSAEQLSPVQKFGVVLFRETEDGTGVESFSPVLVRATPTAKRRLAEWLGAVEPRGASNPLAGLEVALAMKPDAVFLLSRSIARSGGGVWEQGLDATLARLDELNPPTGSGRGPVRRPVLIQTIQFLDDDPTGIMQAIGARHGQGAGYRVVRRSEDLARRPR